MKTVEIKMTNAINLVTTATGQVVLYRIRFGTQAMLGVREVKGDATDASNSDSEIPPWALFSACNKISNICY